MKIYIKNMVCDRCRKVVANTLAEIGLKPINIDLGEVDFGDAYGDQLSQELQALLANKLEDDGFELLNSKKSKLIENIKIASIDYLEHYEELNGIKLSNHLSNKLNLDYNHLSNLFSAVEGVTIEHYFIRLRIEKVKELLVYDESSLSEIAFSLGFSSVSHLSSQFKKITGLTPGHFRSLKFTKDRKPLDKL